MSTGFEVKEEYIEGAVRIGDVSFITLTFQSFPPSEWKNEYDAKIESVERNGIFYVVKIQEEIRDFIEEKMPEFGEYVDLAEEKHEREHEGVVLRLPKELLYDSPEERERRLAKFKEIL